MVIKSATKYFSHTQNPLFLPLRVSTELCCLRHVTCTDRWWQKKKSDGSQKETHSEETLKPQTAELIALLVNIDLPHQ